MGCASDTSAESASTKETASKKEAASSSSPAAETERTYPEKYYRPYKYDGTLRNAETKPLGYDIRYLYDDLGIDQTFNVEVTDHSSDTYFAIDDGYTMERGRDACVAFINKYNLSGKMGCYDYSWNGTIGVMASYIDR